MKQKEKEKLFRRTTEWKGEKEEREEKEKQVKIFKTKMEYKFEI